MMIPNANQTVREIAIESPATVRVFESLGIDYCCGGRQSLKDACAAAGVPIDEILPKLTGAQAATLPEDANQWQQATLRAITSHIVETHHGFVRRETPRLFGLFGKVRSRHDENHPELRAIEKMFSAMT